MDLASFGAALTSLKTATEIAQLIKTSSTTLEKAELNLRLADLITSLADTKMQLADIKQGIVDRDIEIGELRASLKKREEIVYEAPYYWLGQGLSRHGPFCQKCFDAGEKLIRLQSSTHTRGWWHCQSCSNTVHDKDYREAPINFRSQWE